MSSHSYTIVGNDFDRGGMASHRLKQQLKMLGVAPDIIRRTIIAAYEAEMNVVIYARRGNMYFSLTDTRIDVEVVDEGPGIPDISLAMTEGYSTAPAKIREMGFGLGLGLPNMKKASDSFEIWSTVGRGTRVHFSNDLTGAAPGATRSEPICTEGVPMNSLQVREEECTLCGECLGACPTEAIRLRKGKPAVIDPRCIDCVECIGVCTASALAVDVRNAADAVPPEQVLVLHQSFLVQFKRFGAGGGPHQVIGALKKLGFREVLTIEGWEKALSESVLAYAENEAALFPVISPVCPAVINLIRMRFPALIGQIAPFLTPFEAAARDDSTRSALFVPLCPGQNTLLHQHTRQAESRRTVTGNTVQAGALFQKVASLLAAGDSPAGPREKAGSPEPQPPAGSKEDAGKLEVSGMARVIELLEKVENGEAGDIPVLELYACVQGCFGSPLLKENAFLSRYRLDRNAQTADQVAARVGRPETRREVVQGSGPALHERASGGAMRRNVPLTPRTGMRLDASMKRAIEKLSEIERIVSRLPGKNCRLCGAPRCSAFAEDVVQGKADETECVFLQGEEKEHEVG